MVSSERVEALRAVVEAIVIQRLASLPVSERLVIAKTGQAGHLIFEIRLLLKSDDRHPAWVGRQVVLLAAEAKCKADELYEIVRNRTISACNDFVGLGPPPPMPEGLLERVDNAIARFDKEW